MRILHSSASVFFTMLVVVGCNIRGKDKIAKTEMPAPVKTIATTNTLAGQWKFNNTIWYTEELILMENGGFKFYAQGCYGQTFTDGNWTNSGRSVFLTSFDRYKIKNENSEVINVSYSQARKNKKLKNGEVEWHVSSLKDVAISGLSRPNDTSGIYFNNVKLNLEADTLYCADNNQFIGEHKFGRIKSIR